MDTLLAILILPLTAVDELSTVLWEVGKACYISLHIDKTCVRGIKDVSFSFTKLGINFRENDRSKNDEIHC